MATEIAMPRLGWSDGDAVAAGGIICVIESAKAQDLLVGRALEVDEVFADLVDRAARAGVFVPRIRLVRDLIRDLAPGRDTG